MAVPSSSSTPSESTRTRRDWPLTQPSETRWQPSILLSWVTNAEMPEGQSISSRKTFRQRIASPSPTQAAAPCADGGTDAGGDAADGIVGLASNCGRTGAVVSKQGSFITHKGEPGISTGLASMIEKSQAVKAPINGPSSHLEWDLRGACNGRATRTRG